MTTSDHIASIGSTTPSEDDEDKVFDDWYDKAGASAERGLPNPFGLSGDELEWIEDLFDEEEAEPTDDCIDGGENGADEDQDDEDQDASGSEKTCGICDGSRFEPGGDGAQCDGFAGSGTVPAS